MHCSKTANIPHMTQRLSSSGVPPPPFCLRKHAFPIATILKHIPSLKIKHSAAQKNNTTTRSYPDVRVNQTHLSASSASYLAINSLLFNAAALLLAVAHDESSPSVRASPSVLPLRSHVGVAGAVIEACHPENSFAMQKCFWRPNGDARRKKTSSRSKL